MSLLTIGLALIPGGGAIALGIAIVKFGARTVFGKIGSAAKGVDWPKLYRTVAMIGLPVALFLVVHEWGEARHENKLRVAAEASAVHWQAQDKVDVAAHLVTKASLTAALGEINAANARSEAAHKMLLEQEAYWQSKDAENVARFKDTAAIVAQLERGAAGKRDVPCKLSAGAVKALDGL